MTIQEFHIGIDIELDKTLDFEYPYISPEQKDYWLNKAQERFIDNIAYPKNKNDYGFEEVQKNIDQIRTIVVTSSGIVPSEIITNKFYTINLPIDYKYLVGHECITKDNNSFEVTVPGVQVRHDSVYALKKDPFWKPTPIEPLYYLTGNQLQYETDGFKIINSFPSYIRIEDKIQYGSNYSNPLPDLNCTLPVHTHHKILDIAVSMLLENIESQRYQSNLNEAIKS
jgi:hypothetical protein